MKRLFALLMIVVGTSAYGATMANTDCCPCPSTDWCCGEFCVDAELLIWRALDCVEDYGMTPAILAGATQTNLFTVAPEFDLGFRVNPRYTRDCLFLDGRYTWFQSSDIKEVSRGNVPNTNLYGQSFASNVQFSQLSSRLRYAYEDANIRLGMQCLGNRCCQLYSWLEGRYAHIKSIRTIQGVGTTGSIGTVINRDVSSFDGGGLGMGFGIQAQFLSCLQVSAEFTTFGLVGAHNVTDVQISDAGGLPAFYQTRSSFIPGYNARLKIAYANCYCGIDYGLYFSWEINEYFGGELMTHPFIAFNATGDPPARVGQIVGNRQCTDLGFGGPSVGFTVCY